MPLQSPDGDEDLERSRVSSDLMGNGVEGELPEESNNENSDAMNASNASRAKFKGNGNTKGKGVAFLASTARLGRQTRGVHSEKRNAAIVSLADVDDDGQESDNETSSDNSDLPDLSKFRPIIQPGTRKGTLTKNSGVGTDDNVDSARPARASKKRGRTPKGEEDRGLSEQTGKKRRGRPAATPPATMSSPAARLASRSRGRQNVSRSLVAANETGQRRSARAAAAAAEMQATAAVEDKAKKFQAATSVTKPTRARGAKPAANKHGEYIVEAITNHRLNKNASPEYFVKWEGYPASQNTWEPKRNLNKCKAALNDYLKKAAKA